MTTETIYFRNDKTGEVRRMTMNQARGENQKRDVGTWHTVVGMPLKKGQQVKVTGGKEVLAGHPDVEDGGYDPEVIQFFIDKGVDVNAKVQYKNKYSEGFRSALGYTLGYASRNNSKIDKAIIHKQYLF